MPIIVVGSANMDLVVRAPRFPAPGETIIGSGFETHPGGKGANQAVAAAKLGGNTRFVGCVGRDPFGDSLRQSLNDAGVDVSALRVDDTEPTGIAAITVDSSAQNTIVVAPGANSRVRSTDAIAELRPDSILLLQLEIPIDAVCDIISSRGSKLTILNPAPAHPIPEQVLAAVDIATPNENEIYAMTGIAVHDLASAEAGCRKLMDMGAGSVVVTLGARGAFAMNSAGARHIEPLPVEPVDTVAAGDAFCGALAVFLDQGRDLFNAASLACMAASLATTKRGAQESMPTLEELRRVAGPLI